MFFQTIQLVLMTQACPSRPSTHYRRATLLCQDLPSLFSYNRHGFQVNQNTYLPEALLFKTNVYHSHDLQTILQIPLSHAGARQRASNHIVYTSTRLDAITEFATLPLREARFPALPLPPVRLDKYSTYSIVDDKPR